MTSSTADRCTRPGCTGRYAPDGYCDECGHKAPAAVSGTAPSGPVSVGMGAPSGLGTVATGAGLGGTGSTGRSTRSRAGRGGLGANLVVVPPVPLRDPASAVMTDPRVPESHRFCGKCGEPVGRGKDGQPGRVDGFCPHDGTPFSFRPRLALGDLVDRRYEILGALAHGGLGWIYLARDRNISESGADRWVVLKGLINTGDADAMAAAVAERRFLVEVDHPNIVNIHDFAQHPDPKTGELVGYIVMEYVGGRSLKDLALKNLGPDGKRVPLPLAQVLAYAIEILPALGYLHDRGLLFCDFKPDNVIHAEEQLKLIDLGAVRRADDHASALWGTPGYQAPELAARGASVASDLYTVGRAMAVLSFDFAGFSSRYAGSLPARDDVPLFQAEESYYRLLLRATHPDPDHRFESAGDLAEQALGVLREVLSAADGVARPATSGRFTPERRAFGTGSVEDRLDGPTVAAALPQPLVDPADPAAPFLATLSGGSPADILAALRTAPVWTVEVTLRLVRALLDARDLAGARQRLDEVPAGDWRRDWHAGLLALCAGQPAEARAAFDAVYSALPGEPAARLAVAVAAELAGDFDAAIRRYHRVWCVDRGYPSAAFGLARMLLRTGNRTAAVSTLDQVPDSSSQYQAAQVAAVRTQLDHTAGQLSEMDLVQASGRLERLRLDAARRATLAVEMFQTALVWLGALPGQHLAGTTPAGRPVASGQHGPGGPAGPGPINTNRAAVVTATGTVLGQALRERDVRLGLERAYRSLAALETDPLAKYALVDQANAVRPRTVF